MFSFLPNFMQDYLRILFKRLYTSKLKRDMLVAGFPKTITPDFNEILHYLRGVELDGIPKNIGNFLSVGCAGTWYFEWIEKHCGPIKQHIGIEYYASKPNDLPKNAIWVANTAGNLKDVTDQSADVLFSGQNIEHLWLDDVINFLLESYRVLKPGGLLAIDSPNRTVTRAIIWSHPEHTLEYTAEEMVELLNLSGFDVQTNHGLWRCIDDDGNPLNIFSILNYSSNTLKWRVSTAKNNPNKSFVWWINARRSTWKIPDPEALQVRLQQIFLENWTERVRRMLTVVGRPVGKNSFMADNPGVLMYGPYMPLPEGRYTVVIALEIQVFDSSPHLVASCDILSGDGILVTQKEINHNQFDSKGRIQVEMNFALEKMTFGIQFRVITHSKLVLFANGDVVLKSHLVHELSTVN